MRWSEPPRLELNAPASTGRATGSAQLGAYRIPAYQARAIPKAGCAVARSRSRL